MMKDSEGNWGCIAVIVAICLIYFLTRSGLSDRMDFTVLLTDGTNREFEYSSYEVLDSGALRVKDTLEERIFSPAEWKELQTKF